MTKAEHLRLVGRQPCVVSGRTVDVTIHHAQGPSIRARLAEMGLDPTKSQNMRANGDALILPLAAEFHTGNLGIDMGMGRATWEARFGAQADFIDELGWRLGYSFWDLHREWYSATKIFRRT